MNKEMHAMAMEAYAECDGIPNVKVPKQFVERFYELIVSKCAEEALRFNNNLQSLNDKEVRTHSRRIENYILDRFLHTDTVGDIE